MSVGTLTREARRPVLRSGVAGAARSPVALAVVGLTVLAGVLRFTRIGHQGFWFDEGNTALLLQFSPGKLFSLIRHTESTPPLYYYLAWVWVRVFGHGEAGLRSLSAVVGVAVVPVAYGVGAKLVSRRAGVIVAALAACNPLLIWYSQEGRAYSLLVFLTACSLLAFAFALESPTRRALAAWVIACALALATHYYAVVAVVPQAVWLLFVHRRRREVMVAVAIVGLCGLALIPLAVSQNSTGHDSWIRHAPFGPRLRQILPQLLIGTNAPARVALKFVAFGAALVALVMLFAFRRGGVGREGSRADGAGALLAGALALAGFALALAFVVAGSDSLITRNIIALWLPAAVALAGGLALAPRGGWRVLAGAVAVAVCVIGVVASVGIAFDRSMQRPDWRYVARALGPSPSTAGVPRAGRPVAGRAILIQHYKTLLPLSLYMPGLHYVTRRNIPVVRELDVISMTSPQQPLCWWGAACNLIPSQMQARYDIPGFREVSRRRALQWTILRLVSDRPVRLTPALVSRSLHTTTLRRDELLVQG
ncbi:MAG: glycosyltransferase family 39 protein [Solirubrobacteraceae bacterium]